MIRLTTIFGQSRDQNGKCLKTYRVYYVVLIFLTQQYENIITQNL